MNSLNAKIYKEEEDKNSKIQTSYFETLGIHLDTDQPICLPSVKIIIGNTNFNHQHEAEPNKSVVVVFLLSSVCLLLNACRCWFSLIVGGGSRKMSRLLD